MYIREVLRQHRRDMRVTYMCNYCHCSYEGSAYDDDNFHKNVIPNMICRSCGRKAGEEYEARETKYHKDQII